MMGIVHTQLWEDPSGARAGAPTSPETIRAEIVTMVLHTIRRG
jgi:hypothetical protein